MVQYVFVEFSNFVTMTECLEQCYCIKFCPTLGETQVETICKIHQTFSDDAVVDSQIKMYNQFKDGRVSMESEQCSEHSSTSWNYLSRKCIQWSFNTIIIWQSGKLLMKKESAFVLQTLFWKMIWVCGESWQHLCPEFLFYSFFIIMMKIIKVTRRLLVVFLGRRINHTVQKLFIYSQNYYY